MAACHEFSPACRISTQTGRLPRDGDRSGPAVLYSSAAGSQGGAGGKWCQWS